MDICINDMVSRERKPRLVNKKIYKNKNDKKEYYFSSVYDYQNEVITENRYGMLYDIDNEEIGQYDENRFDSNSYVESKDSYTGEAKIYEYGSFYSKQNKDLKFKTRVIWNSKYKKTTSNHEQISGVNSNSNKNFKYTKNEDVEDIEYKEEYKNKDYLNLKFKRCSNKRCKTCIMINEQQLDNDSIFIFCKTYNCIYNLKCNSCGFNYIGQTSNTINIRINQHRSDTKNYKKNKNINNNIEIGHFNIHGFDKIEISIIKIVPNLKNRLWWENFFINSFNTIYPYGLNVIYFNKNVLQMSKGINSQFYYRNSKNDIKRHFKSKKAKKKRENRLFTEIKVTLTKLSLDFDKDFNIKSIKRFMFGLNKAEIKSMRELFEDNLPNTHGWDLISDIYRFIFKKYKLKLENRDQIKTEYCTFLYMNKNYDRCSFSSILNKYSYCFPLKNINIKRAFRYNKQLGRMIFNYNKIKEVCDIDKCCCEKYENYIDKHHGHVITGDLNIVQDTKLRDIMFKGTKHRLIMDNNNSNIRAQIKKDVDDFILKIAVKYSMPYEAFNEYKVKILNEIFKHNFRANRDVRFRDLKTAIENLQKEFVIVYIDKVPGNFAIICKFYYCSVLKEHLKDNEAYIESNLMIRELDNRIKAFYRKLNLQCQRVKYPHVFLTPKFHKNPIKFRSVTNGSNTYISKIGKILQKYLQEVIDELKGQNNTKIINNSLEVIKYTKDLVIYNLHSYDFQDLFNSIDIKDMIEVLIKIYEDFDLKRYINNTKFKTLINLVLNENYVNFDNKFYKQIKGIPQGGPASNALANLYLHFYEKEIHFDSAVMFRYIDDLLIITKEKDINTILDFYPGYLKLIKTNDCSTSAEFLDLDIEIIENKLSTKIYDKRKDFKFIINKLPYWNSNISGIIYKNIIINFVHRCNSLISDFNNRKIEIQNFFNTALRYGYPIHYLCTYIDRRYLQNLSLKN